MKLVKTDNLLGHYHVCVVEEESGYGYVAAAEKHTHEILFTQGTPAQQDQTGAVVVPGSPPQFIIAPASTDRHSHEIIAAEFPPLEEDKEDDSEIISEVYRLFGEWLTGEQESREIARKCDDYFCGRQWDTGLVQKLDKENRAHLTLNAIQRYVHELCGHQINNRTDIRYLPQEGGDQRIADIYNHVVKFILDSCGFTFEETEVFKDQVIGGRGVFNTFVDTTKDIRGEIKVERFPWEDIAFGPHNKPDLSDCEGFVKHKMFSRAKLKGLYPDKWEQLEGAWNFYLGHPDVEENLDGGKGNADRYAFGGSRYPVYLGGVKMIDMERKDMRVVEAVTKIYYKIDVAVNEATGYVQSLYGWPDAAIRQVKTIPDFKLVEQDVVKFRVRRVCGGVVLLDKNPADLPVDEFLTFPVYGEKRKDFWWGKVALAVDPQDELNKRHSQAIDIGNKMASYGWFYEEDTFPQGEEANFKENANSPGFFQKVNNLDRLPAKVEGTKFPTEIVQLMQMSDELVFKMMNVSVNPTGANESASHLQHLQQQKMVGNEYLFDSLSRAKKKLGEMLIPLIRAYYGPDRIHRILINQSQKPNQQDMQIGGQPVSEFTPEAIQELFDTFDAEKYDVVVSENAQSVSARMATFSLMMELNSQGVPIPPEILLSYADLPEDEKSKIMNAISQQQQAAAEQEKTKSNTEMLKTLVAKGMDLTTAQTQLGLQPTAPQAQQAAPNMNGQELSNQLPMMG